MEAGYKQEPSVCFLRLCRPSVTISADRRVGAEGPSHRVFLAVSYTA